MAGHVDYGMSVEWTTEIPRTGIPLQSPDIYFLNSEWYLKLCFEWSTLREKSCLYLYLFNKKKENYKKKITVTTGVHEVGKLNIPMLSDCLTVSKSGDCIWECTVQDVSDTIPNIDSIGKFTVFCVFRHQQSHVEKNHGSTEDSLTSSISPTVVENLLSLSRDWSRSLKDETLSDVKLKCGDRTFSAHRVVLASRSEVFAAMFRNKMAETDTGMVYVQDIDPEVLELLLEYMYSGKLLDLRDDNARLLYEASDKYAVLGLKNACSQWMLENQTEKNCLDLLVLADKHSDENFKESVVSFVAEHQSLSTKSWSAFKKEHPRLVVAVLEKRLAA